MAQGDQIKYSDISTLVTRLKVVYTTHALTFPAAVDAAADSIKPKSAEITAIYNAFQSAYSEEHLATVVKWTIGTGELNVGSPMLWSTVANATASLVDMESKTHYSRVVNTNAPTYTQTSNTATSTYTQTTNSVTTTYTQTTHTNGYTYSDTTHSNGTGYSQTTNGKSCTQNTMRNSSRSGNSQCSCYTVYGSDCSQTYYSSYGTTYSYTTYSNVTTYTRTVNTAGVVHSQTTNTAGTTYSQTTYTAGTNYTES